METLLGSAPLEKPLICTGRLDRWEFTLEASVSDNSEAENSAESLPEPLRLKSRLSRRPLKLREIFKLDEKPDDPTLYDVFAGASGLSKQMRQERKSFTALAMSGLKSETVELANPWRCAQTELAHTTHGSSQ